MECATGDILAMANLKREGEECVEVQNYAIGVPVNPGSTFKLVSAMALLEHGVPTSQKYHSGLGKRVEVGGAIGAKVQDSHAIAKETGGVIDMRRAFSESANVYFTKAVFEKFGSKPVVFSDFCRGLHLHETVGLEEWGAQKKSLPHLDKRHHSRINALVNMAYGYGLEVTPLHTIAVYNAVANNGRMVAPRLILRTERDGEVVSEAPVRVIEEKICKQSTVDTLRSFMEEVSLTGTAAEYFGEKRCSFRTGSKTGTAQVDSEINGVRYKRGDGYYYGSMVTYLPADNPRYTIMTAIFTKRQTGKFYYGASLSGPVQKRVATFLYNRDLAYAEEVSGEECFASEIKGGNIEKMRKVASEYGGKFSAESRHGWGEGSVGNDGKLHISPIDMADDVVPNVVGMGLNDALYLLERCGLTVEVVGYGSVVKQSIAPNSKVAKTNKRIKIELR
jgi:cell division protein FtsI (penicillin-binding protein 3)